MKNLASRLATQGMQAALHVRAMVGADLHSPVCIYDVCDQLRVQVRFADIKSMEGMYYQGNPARIVIGARRPLPRRNFSCGHELGHHVCGHGSTIDELQDAVANSSWQPDEFLVNSFSAALLMPHVGLKRAFAVRGTTSGRATPRELFTISCNFGVGYETLVNHLAYGTGMISKERAEVLARISPKEIRRQILGRETQEPLIVMDDHWTAATVDLEVGTFLLAPKGTSVEGLCTRFSANHDAGELFQAVNPGIGRLLERQSGRSRFVRVSRFQFIGLSRFRHLEEVEHDEH